LYGLEAGKGAVVVEVVEEGMGLADLGGEVDGVGVWVRGVAEEGRNQGQNEEKGEKKGARRIA